MRQLKTLKRLYDDERQVVVTEKGSPPRVLFFGEDFLLEDLPLDTRVVFPRTPLQECPTSRRRSAGRSITPREWSRSTPCSVRG